MNDLMKYDPATGWSKPYPSHAAQWREHNGETAWLFNPWTGERRNAQDVGSDPFGLLIHSGGAAIRALKQPQADKDDGQQRACTCHADDRPAGDCQKQYAATDCQQRAGDECKHARAHRAGDRQGYACPDCGEFVSDYEIHRRQRAALSAPQADGIRRPLPYIDSTQEPPK